MPDRCVAANCSNIGDPANRIFIHTIPFFGDSRPEALKRRKKWIDFVKTKRAHWEPTKGSAVCSKHFKAEDYVYQYAFLPGMSGKPSVPRLKRDKLGVIVFPTIHSTNTSSECLPQTSRTTRKVVRDALTEASPRTDTTRLNAEEIENSEQMEPSTEDHVVLSTSQPDVDIHVDDQMETITMETITDTSSSCTNCSALKGENRQLRNQVKSLQDKLKDKRKVLRKTESQAKNLEQQMADKDTTEPAEEVTVCDDRDDECDELDGGGESEGEGDTEYEDETDMTTETETETESEEEIGKSNRMSMTGTNLRTEPKFIVFLSQLLLLFKVCHVCKTDNPELETKQVGTEAVVTTSCSNPKCPKQVNTWHSQPTMPNSQIPAGNFLLCMAVLLAGSSATKVFQVFKHMGLCCVSLNTYFRYQRSKMFPTILIFWESYQAKLLAKVKAIREGVSMAGDGRHDSMGHSAKFGAYTMFCCTIPMIIHFVLIQRNQAGNSPAMEFMGFKECINFLLGYGIVITSFISDRHLSIACHMRKVLTGITHYFDIWHLKKKIRKVLSKISKLKGCEVISEWIKPCENHLYWSAASTYSGNGLVIYAKFKTFLSHIIDKHSSLPDALFNKCGHGVLRPRKWLTAGSVAYEKLCSALTNNSLVKGIKQASPFAQTSCLEGFHSLLNQFAPKMIAYSYVGMYCRHILAVVHFNMNLQRETKKKDVDGVERVKVSYPKFKNGEATVRNARIEQNFDYVEEIFQTYLMASKDDIGDATNKLKEMTPAPMNSMLEKQPRGEAVEKREKRRSMVVADIPPTTPVSQPTASTSTTASSSKPKKRSRTDTPSSASQPKKKRAKAPSSARRPKEKPANTRTTSTANRPKKKPANTRTTSTANRPKKKPRTDAPSSTQRPGKRSQRKPSTPSRPGKRSRKQ